MAQFYTAKMMDGRRLLMEVFHIDCSSGYVGIQGVWRATLQ